MKRKCVYLFLLFILCLQINAQSKKDSLWAVWKNVENEDTVRLRAIDRLSKACFKNMPDSAIAYTQMEYDFAKKRNLKRFMAAALSKRGCTYQIKSDYIKSLECHQQCLTLNQEMRYEKGIAICLNNIGVCYNEVLDEVNALRYYYKALKIFAKISEKVGLSSTLYNISDMYYQVGALDSAISLTKQSLKISTEIGDNGRIASSYDRLGKVYYMKSKLDEAESFHQKAILLFVKLNDQWHLATSYNHLANVYYSKKLYTFAKKYATKSLEIGKELKDSLSIGESLVILSSIMYEMGDVDRAISLGEKGLIALRNKHAPLVCEKLAVNMAMWYSEQKKYLKAKEMHLAYTNYRKAGNHEGLKEELLQQKLKNDFEKKELLAKVINEKKLTTLRADSERINFRKNLILMGSLALLLIFLLSSYFIYQHFKQKNIITNQKNNILKQQLLVSQMSPHFIFNSLNAVQNFIFKQDSYNAGIYLKQFSELIRMILEFSRKDLISLEEELNFLKNYLELQKLRFNSKFNYELKIDPTLDNEMVLIPPMLAQPFIENAIEHGIFYKNGEGFLSIRISLKENKLLYEIEDDGIGLEKSLKLNKELNTKHKSLAIIIAKERVAAMNNEKKSDFKIEINDKVHVNNKSTGVYVKFSTPYLTL